MTKLMPKSSNVERSRASCRSPKYSHDSTGEGVWTALVSTALYVPLVCRRAWGACLRLVVDRIHNNCFPALYRRFCFDHSGDTYWDSSPPRIVAPCWFFSIHAFLSIFSICFAGAPCAAGWGLFSHPNLKFFSTLYSWVFALATFLTWLVLPPWAHDEVRFSEKSVQLVFTCFGLLPRSALLNRSLFAKVKDLFKDVVRGDKSKLLLLKRRMLSDENAIYALLQGVITSNSSQTSRSRWCTVYALLMRNLCWIWRRG